MTTQSYDSTSVQMVKRKIKSILYHRFSKIDGNPTKSIFRVEWANLNNKRSTEEYLEDFVSVSGSHHALKKY